jgi:hypothetical protein
MMVLEREVMVLNVGFAFKVNRCHSQSKRVLDI